jgi:hypothetical protein
MAVTCAAAYAQPPTPPAKAPGVAAPAATPQPGDTPGVATPSGGDTLDEGFIEFLGSDDVGDADWWEFLKRAPPRGNNPPAPPPQDANK